MMSPWVSKTQGAIDDLKSFSIRLKQYSKCLRGKCSKQERTDLKQYILSDGAKTLFGLGLVAGASAGIGYGIFKIKKQKEGLQPQILGVGGSESDKREIASIKEAFKQYLGIESNLALTKIERPASLNRRFEVTLELKPDNTLSKEDFLSVVEKFRTIKDKDFIESIVIKQKDARLLSIYRDGKLWFNDYKVYLMPEVYNQFQKTGFIKLT